MTAGKTSPVLTRFPYGGIQFPYKGMPPGWLAGGYAKDTGIDSPTTELLRPSRRYRRNRFFAESSDCITVLMLCAPVGNKIA
jgi:hypothetical protein